jgi:hypothetical protein
MQSNFSERAAKLQNKTQRFMDQINALESEMKSHLMKAKIDVQTLHDNHNYKISETQIKYDNKLEENKIDHNDKERNLLQTVDEQNRHIDYLTVTNNQFVEEKNLLKEQIARTLEVKEQAKDKITELENELRNERKKKEELEYEHQLKIHEFELNKSALLNEHQNKKNSLNSKIEELANKLTDQQKNAIETELQRNAEKKEKEDELTGKIHQFSNVESDLSKQIDCNYADIEYLESMSKYLEADKRELLDSYSTQKTN